jgi:peptidoglycan/xylan/chitin deacetylase (PgdA/CDA1 family)
VDTQLRARGLAELDWDVDPSDYLRPGAAVITRRVLAALHPGAIVILHDGGGKAHEHRGCGVPRSPLPTGHGQGFPLP